MRFSAKISSFTPKLNTGKHNVNLVNTYKTILVAFYNPYKFQKNLLTPNFCLAKQPRTRMSYIFENTPIANFWYPASLELDTSAISNKMKSPNNDVYDTYTILLERNCIIFIQKTF